MLDATIIGAGPAGCAAALLLARNGTRVTLIEQHRFPRDKVCGECLSALGVDVLDRLGITTRLKAIGAVSLRSANIHAFDGASFTTKLPRAMLGISRYELDAIMLAAAREAGVAIWQPARCERLARAGQEADGASAPSPSYSGERAGVRGDIASCAARRTTPHPNPLPRVRGRGNLRSTSSGDGGEKPVLLVRDLQRNTVETLSPSIIILADGKSALATSAPSPTGDIGIKSHWIGVDGPRDAIELFGCADCYGGLAAIENGRWNAAFSVSAERLRAHHGDIDKLFAELLNENGILARRLAQATRTNPWLGSPVPRFPVAKNWPAGVIPIGNAAAALEPIGGEGMGLALRSAELAVMALAGVGDRWTSMDARKLQGEYQRLWRSRRMGCRAAAVIVSSPRMLNIAMELGKCNHHVAEVGMRMIGKSLAVATSQCT